MGEPRTIHSSSVFYVQHADCQTCHFTLVVSPLTLTRGSQLLASAVRTYRTVSACRQLFGSGAIPLVSPFCHPEKSRTGGMHSAAKQCAYNKPRVRVEQARDRDAIAPRIGAQ